LAGLRPEVLGNYLASLGLLRILARRWPTLRIAWRNRVLHVVGEPDLDAIVCALLKIAVEEQWSPYERKWQEAQRASSKMKSGRPLALWQATAPEAILELFAAHAVPHAEVDFNPLLGIGGNAGQRKFAKGREQAVERLKQQTSHATPRPDELRAWLVGEPVSGMVAGLNAASWFSNANKLYNSGQGAFREEALSPWAMALACEGLPFFAGAASRRLGAALARTRGAFPFVTGPGAPTSPGEVTRDLGEVWAPLWERPMTLPEVRALFHRGRAEVQGKGAHTPGAFAVAVFRRGVDAGISGFLRFSLCHTTSTRTFEPRYEGFIQVPPPHAPELLSSAEPLAVQRVLDLIERLPRDHEKRLSFRYIGLRGPIEMALLRLAQAQDSPEAVRALVDATTSVLDRVDRNRTLREECISWEPLPLEYLPALFGDEEPCLEARLALALVSSFPRSRPFTLYRFGVTWHHNRYGHDMPPPARWVWGGGAMSRLLVRVLARRTLDWEEGTRTEGIAGEAPVRILLPVSCFDVMQWLQGHVDETLMERWVTRLAIFDWRTVAPELQKRVRGGGQVTGRMPEAADRVPAHGLLCLFGLLQPLVDLCPVPLRNRNDDLLHPETGARTPAVARRLIALVHAGQIDAAVELAASRYAMARAPLARLEASWFVGDPDRLLASFLFPVAPHERATLVERWLRPQRDTQGR